jgi:hypothetical protein
MSVEQPIIPLSNNKWTKLITGLWIMSIKQTFLIPFILGYD